MRSQSEDAPLLGERAAETAFLAGWKAVAADVCVIVAATVVVVVVAGREGSNFEVWEPSSWPSSVFIELAFCVVGLLGNLNVVVSGSGYAGLYVGSSAADALLVNGQYVLVLGAIIASDYGLRIALGGEPLRAFSNWSVMIASGASANLMAPWPFSHRALGSIDKRLWVALWLCYQACEAYVSLFGALDEGWLLIVLTLVVRRAVFIACMALICLYTYGSFGRFQKLQMKAAVVPLFCPSQSVGKWQFDANPDGSLSIDYEPYEFRTPEPIPNSQELAAMGGAFLLKFHMLGGMAPCPPDLNPIVFLEQMISFGSPTAVIGSRAAIGHILYVAEFVSGILTATLTFDDLRAVDDDMAKPPAERLPFDKRVNRFKSRAAARLLMSRWLLDSRARALDVSDAADIDPDLRKCEADDKQST